MNISDMDAWIAFGLGVIVVLAVLAGLLGWIPIYRPPPEPEHVPAPRWLDAYVDGGGIADAGGPR